MGVSTIYTADRPQKSISLCIDGDGENRVFPLMGFDSDTPH